MPHPIQRKIPGFLLALLAIASVLAIWTSFHYDDSVRATIVAAQQKNWKKSDESNFYSMVRRYGDWPWLMAAAAAGLVITWKLKSREWSQILVAAIIASTLSGLIANTSRLTTGRTRPKETPKIAEGFYGPWKDSKLTIGDSKYNSFPSGHTATAFGFAGAIFFASPWLGIAALVLAGLIGWSSVVTGNHHPSDVVVSIVLSMIVAWFTWRQVQRYSPLGWLWLRHKFKRR
ncbi:hypothetical protein BH09VER1_BH09VER1_21890 [soil metagenome]